MKDCAWKLIWICTSVSTAFAIERSVWMPTCSTTSTSTAALISHPTDCRKFFVCIQGISYPVSCPYGLNWNSILNKCSTLSSCDNKQYNKIPKYNPLCPLDENPENPTHLPDIYDCGKFYECQGGFAFHMVCPDQMHWSVEHGSCEDASVANCKDSHKAIGNGQLNADCPFNDDPNDPIHLPHPEDCTKFLKCAFGRSYIISCPFGLHWDVDASRCESPFIAQCKKTKLPTVSSITSSSPSPSTIRTSPTQTSSTAKPSPPTIKTSPTQTSSTAKPSSPNYPICPENGVRNFGIPGQCDKYFSCSQGKLYMMACREGRQWNEIVSGCVDSNLAGCTGLSNGQPIITSSTKIPLNGPVSSSNTQRPPATARPTSCTPGIGFLSHPTDCHKYIVCDNGKPVEMSCPDGLFFSYATYSCQWTDIEC